MEPSLVALARYFLRLGTLGFGGPIALAGAMQRDLVDDRKWIAPEDFKQGLALAQLAPGPLAAQLAIYLGWVRGRLLGATVVALAFILPSFVMVLGLAALYVHFGGLSWMQGVFYGVGAAVIAIIARSAWKLGKSTLGKRWLLWGVALGNAAVVALTEREIVWLFLASGAIVLVAEHPRTAKAAVVVPPWLVTGIGGVAKGGTLLKLLGFFAQAGAVVFGSGLAIVPFMHGGVVDDHHWLTDQQFLDAVAVAMITPGPVVITVAFIGYLVAGPAGASVAALGVFLPCYLFVVIPAPFYRRIADNRRIKAFVDGVTAAAAGAIAGAAIVLARRAIVDLPAAAIAIATLAAITMWKKLPEPLVIVAAGAIGFGLWTAQAHADPKIAKPVKLALPGGTGGIGFDDLIWSPALHRVIAPAGRTGTLDLVDPKTQNIGAKLAGNPDYVRWVEPAHEVWVTEPNKKAIAVAADSHCVAVDDANHAYVCDPKAGALLVVTDPFPATKP